MLSKTLLQPAEVFVLTVTLVLGGIDVALILARGSAVDGAAYKMILGLAALLVAVGYIYRRLERSEGIGAATTCAGLFIAFTAAASLFNYLLLPNGRPTIDHWVNGLDASLGFSWPAAVAFGATHPFLNEIMRFAYMSTLPQIALLVVLLGLRGRLADLHGLLVTVVTAALVTVAFWGLFPTTGPSAIYALPEELLAKARPLLGPEYGAYVVSVISNGAPYLSPDDFRGLIAFPSFHTVLACAAVHYSRNMRWLFPVLVLVNLAVLPAVVVHGGHYLVDIPAGIAVFLLSLAATRAVFRSSARQRGALAQRPGAASRVYFQRQGHRSKNT